MWESTSRHNLPASLASFVGRERETAEVRDALRQTRLVTLTGTGGCGKTQLALRVATDLVPRFSDGVWLVQLAPVADAEQVPRAVAASVGVGGRSDQPTVDALVASLATRDLLLVLDNCEHLVDACARLSERLLQGCAQLRILATSREPLRVPGEMTRRVPSLALPAPGALPSPETLADVEAVKLFVERARARRPDFELAAGNASAVADICRRLEGLPLAIELAAAQLGSLTVAQVDAQLDDALRVLGGGSRTVARQETMRATLDWSHALLSGAERILFRRLSVFAGDFEAASARHVCADGPLGLGEIVPLVGGLVEKSLVEAHFGGQEARYHVLEPVRQYAWEQLSSSGEAESLQRHHARFYAELAESAEPELMSADRAAAVHRLASELDNLRVAMTWSRGSDETGDLELGLRLAAALFWFWNFRGEVKEGLDWLEALLVRAEGVSAKARAAALHAAGELSWLLGHDGIARSRLEDSAALYRALGDRRGLAYDLQALAMLLDRPAAREAAEESLRLFREVGDAWGAAHAEAALCFREAVGPNAEQVLERALLTWRTLGDGWALAQILNFLGDLARGQGRDASARARYEEALERLRQAGVSGTVPSLLHNLGWLSLRAGETREAGRKLRESLALFRNQGDQRGMADCLEGLAAVSDALGQPERAARLLGAARALREATGTTIWPANAADVERSVAGVRERLGESAFATAVAEGRALPLDEVLADELTAEHADGAADAAEHGALTAREREVAALVARGLTNRQIGDALVIAEGTARLHVKHILQKLAFSSRAQIAAWWVAERIARPG